MAAGFVFMVTSGLVSCCADIRNISSLPGAVQLPAITNLRELHERSVLLRPDVAQHRVLDVLAHEVSLVDRLVHRARHEHVPERHGPLLTDPVQPVAALHPVVASLDRKSTRLNSS